MENMSKALEIVFGVMIFVIALTVVFSMISQAKQTSDIIFDMQDESKYLADVEELEGLTYYLSQSSTGDSLVTRTVGWETVIPTVYRYAEENYGVTIVDASGKIVARYDLDTESVVGNWYSNKLSDIKKTYNENQFNYLTKKVIAGYNNNIQTIDNQDKLEELFKKIYKIEGASSTVVKFGNPWQQDSNAIKRRLDADFSSKSVETVTYSNGVTYYRKMFKTWVRK